MTTRSHPMPFGTERLDDGRFRFNLWAPAAATVDLCLQQSGRDTCLPMTAAGGWFHVTTDAASAGSRYWFRIDGELLVADPASRFQPEDVHGPSEVIDPSAYEWRDARWLGRDWQEAVCYELHVGSFTQRGDFAAVRDKLSYLQDLGVTAVELMPVADFPGRCNWGYDGAYAFAPDSRYGRPEDLKALVDEAHQQGLMILLDVVYNHFGPEGNYLHLYAPQFFSRRHQTPWGAAINLDDKDSKMVREFFIHNALYWLEEFHVDGLRLDAVHAIFDDSTPDFLTELAQRINRRPWHRRIHLVLENDHNAAHYLQRNWRAKPMLYTAQWNDDIHHALHVLLTGEVSGYYRDYGQDPMAQLALCLSQGFAYQGQASPHRGGAPRGEPSRELPPGAFVGFLQNHDQVGNRALGERLTRLTRPEPLRAALAVLLLAPAPPLLFMGEEWGCRQPFHYFCDFSADLAARVVEGRRRGFARLPEFADPVALQSLPDPAAPDTFRRSTLDWAASRLPDHQAWLDYYRHLLLLRHARIVPLLEQIVTGKTESEPLASRCLRVRWALKRRGALTLVANLGDAPAAAGSALQSGIFHASHAFARDSALPPWSVFWSLTGHGDLP